MQVVRDQKHLFGVPLLQKRIFYQLQAAIASNRRIVVKIHSHLLRLLLMVK